MIYSRPFGRETDKYKNRMIASLSQPSPQIPVRRTEVEPIVVPKRYSIYLYVSRQIDPDGLRTKYIGSTSRGGHRYFEHIVEGKDGAEVHQWFVEQSIVRDETPDHLVIEVVGSAKEMQVREFLHQWAQKAMGERLKNVDDCGAPTNRSVKTPEDQEFVGAEWEEVKKALVKGLHPPSDSASRTFRFLRNLRDKLGFNEGIEREMALLAVDAVTCPQVIPRPEAVVVAEVRTEKTCPAIDDSGKICGKGHHSFGLCHLHADRKKRADKKAAKDLAASVLPPTA